MKNKAVWTKLLFIAVVIFLIMNISSALHAEVKGSVEFGASNSSVTDTEKFDTKLEVNIKDGKFGADISHEFSKEQSGDDLIELSTSTSLQGNYFVLPDQFIYLGFEYSRDANAGEDDSTKFGAGYGFRTDPFSIQTGLQASTTYSGLSVNREFLSDTAIKIKIPLDAIFEIVGDAGASFVLDDVNDYEISVAPGLMVHLDKNIGLKGVYEYTRKGKPIDGPKDTRTWSLRLVAGF